MFIQKCFKNLTSKLRKSGLDWSLSEDEQQMLYANWIEKTIKNVEEIKVRYLNNKNPF